MYRLSCCRSIRGLAACQHPSRQSFILCLSSIYGPEWEDTEYTYLEYTCREVVCAVDRGGLFHVSDEVFIFFCELDTKARVFLQKLVKSLGNKKQEIIIGWNCLWCMVICLIFIGQRSVLIWTTWSESEVLWLTIRGFSTASACVEQYTKLTKEGSKKSACMHACKKLALYPIISLFHLN